MGARRETAVRLGLAALAVGAFLLAIQLLGAATGALAPTLRTTVERVVHDDLAALGASWLAALVLLNGSVVAAVTLTLFGAGLLATSQVFLMVAGSRLGAAGVVLLVGAIDHLRNPQHTARESMGLGILSFLATYSIYLPATLVGVLALPWFETATLSPGDTAGTIANQPSLVDPVLEWLLGVIGAPFGFVGALALLFGSLTLFDRLFDRLGLQSLPARVQAWLQRPLRSFLLGTVLTALTTSVAFSLGVVVPLYNRDIVDRREMLPFILGASIGTLSDTLLAALVLGLPAAAGVVVLLLAISTALSLAALATYGWYHGTIEWFYNRILRDRAVFAIFLLSLLLVPLALLVR